MGVGQGKTEKGQGGKKGQSGKDNWVTHQEEKQAGRTRRRLETKRIKHTARDDSDQLS